ncbi:MAG: DUF502 domain-containing protein [Bacteroidetes bacterium]|nr:DUF502 domain-containing protein [Bacteroidota bacterium]MCH8524657.1 DUF502 domain-containing protein [Balneolales bacterium]
MKHIPIRKQLLRYFLQGLLFIAPLTVTAYIIYVTFRFIDSLLQDALRPVFGPLIPGIGFIVLVLTLMVIGFFGQTIIGRPLKRWMDRLLAKIPLLNFIYTAFADLFSSFLGNERKFTRPVIVTVNPVTNLEKLGFLTESDLSRIGEPGKVAVYFPHSYNFSGEMFIVPAEQVRPIDLPPGDTMKFIVSGGVAGLNDDAARAE